MPVLKNARHEAFAQAVAKGKSASEAYLAAGYKVNAKTAAEAASRLSRNVKVSARVAELQQKVARKVEVTVESLAGELEEARFLAIAEKQTSAAVSATMGKAKLFGLGIENRRLSGTVRVITVTAQDLDALTDDELAVLEKAYPVLQKLGLIGGDPASEAEEER